MSNILICFLGTGTYEPVHYELSGVKTKQEQRYVPAALVELLGVSEMHVRVLVTKEARAKHWDALSERLRELGVDNTSLKAVDIESPTSETALWTIFEKIIENISDDDQVWLDITHGFRALPVAAVLALTFAQNVKTFKLQALLYGAFEASADGRAPIFDLTAMMTLPTWSESFAEWKRTGRADGLVQQTKPYLEQVQREQQQRTALTGIGDALQQLSDALTMVRHDTPGALADKAVKLLAEANAELPSHPSMKPLGLILGPLKQDIEELRGTPKYDPDTAKERAVTIDAEYLRRLVKTGKWLLARKRLAEASTTLREAITACAVKLVRHGGVHKMEDGGGPYQWHHERFRTSVDRSLQVLSGAERMPMSNLDAPHNKELSEKLTDDELKKAARQALDGLRDPRNKLNHAWTSGQHTKECFHKHSARNFVDRLRDAATAVDRLVELTIAATMAD